MNEVIYFEPSLEEVYAGFDKALKASMEVDVPIWQAVERIILDWEQQHFAAISAFSLKKNTIRKKRWLVKRGKPIQVGGKSARKEMPRYVEEAGHLTGFLADRLTSEERLRGYNLPRYDKAGQTVRGHYEFGINPEYFRDEYPLKLAGWLSQRVPEEIALIAVDDGRVNQLTAILWNMVWEKIEKNMVEAFGV